MNQPTQPNPQTTNWALWCMTVITAVIACWGVHCFTCAQHSADMVIMYREAYGDCMSGRMECFCQKENAESAEGTSGGEP